LSKAALKPIGGIFVTGLSKNINDLVKYFQRAQILVAIFIPRE